MRKIIITLMVILLVSCASTPDKGASGKPELNGYQLEFDPATSQIGEMVGPVTQVQGTLSDITTRAQACAVRILSNVATSTPSVLMALGGVTNSRNRDGGSLIELIDKENGQLVANSLAAYSKGLVQYTVRAKLSVQAKDGRFRIVQSDLGYTNSTSHNIAYWPIKTVAGSGWNDALEALQARSNKLAACIASEKTVSDW